MAISDKTWLLASQGAPSPANFMLQDNCSKGLVLSNVNRRKKEQTGADDLDEPMITDSAHGIPGAGEDLMQ